MRHNLKMFATTSKSDSKKNLRETMDLNRYQNELMLAFQSDCENFLRKFNKKESYTFKTFSELWKDMFFTSIFEDQKFIVSMLTFTENCFLVVKKFLKFSNDLSTQIGALFLLYGFYYKQPIKKLVKIRVILAEYREIEEIVVRSESNDVAYVFAKLSMDEAFIHVTSFLPYGLQSHHLKRQYMDVNDIFKTEDSNTCARMCIDFYRNDEILAQYRTLCQEYDNLKETCEEECGPLREIPSDINFLEHFEKILSELKENDL